MQGAEILQSLWVLEVELADEIDQARPSALERLFVTSNAGVLEHVEGLLEMIAKDAAGVLDQVLLDMPQANAMLHVREGHADRRFHAEVTIGKDDLTLTQVYAHVAPRIEQPDKVVPALVRCQSKCQRDSLSK